MAVAGHEVVFRYACEVFVSLWLHPGRSQGVRQHRSSGQIDGYAVPYGVTGSPVLSAPGASVTKGHDLYLNPGVARMPEASVDQVWIEQEVTEAKRDFTPSVLGRLQNILRHVGCPAV